MKAHSLTLSCLLLTVASCGGGEDGPRNNITLTALPASLELHQGVMATLRLTVTRPETLGDVTITVSGPDGVVGTEVIVAPDTTDVPIDIIASVDAEVGSAEIAVSATAAGGDGAVKLPAEILLASPSSTDLINTALESGAIDYPTSVLYRAYVLVDDDRLPEAYRGIGGEEDLGFPVDAADPSLPAETRMALAPFLVRPHDPTSIFQTRSAVNSGALTSQDVEICQDVQPGQDVVGAFKTRRTFAPIRVWIQCTGDAGLDNVALDSALAHAENIYKPMTDLMGPPVFDDVDEPGNFFDECIDVYVVADGGAGPRNETRQSRNGVTFGAPPYNGHTSSGYILISRSRLDGTGFKSTLAHEFFHVLQNAHNHTFQFERAANDRPSSEFWWVEASATWASRAFAPESAAREVYNRFATFQENPASLHRSYNGPNLFIYAAFIWAYFAEHMAGSGQPIADSWNALRNVTGHDAANDALNGVFDFERNFRLFAIANINEDYPDALARVKRHRGLDKHFPDAPPRPVYTVDKVVENAQTYDPNVDIPPLKAAYYRITPHSQVKKLVVRFDDIAVRDGLDIDGVVNKAGNWKVEDYSGLTKKTFCLDAADDGVTDIILVLSNHSIPLTQFVLGSMHIEASEVPCKSAWEGTVRYENIATTGVGDQHTIDTANIRFEQEDGDDGTGLVTFRSSGTFHFSKTGVVAGCTLTVPDYDGTLDVGELAGTLILDSKTDPVQYQATVSTSSYTVAQFADCEEPMQDFTIEQPLIDPLWFALFDPSRTVSADGQNIAGTRSETNGFFSQSWTWNLTLQSQ